MCPLIVCPHKPDSIKWTCCLHGNICMVAHVVCMVTAAIAETKRQQAVKNYIQSNKVNYVVYGVDQNCNTYNNGTAKSVIPNCAATTTSIAIATNFVAPTDPSWAIASSATSELLQNIFTGGPNWPCMSMSAVAAILELFAYYVCIHQMWHEARAQTLLPVEY